MLFFEDVCLSSRFKSLLEILGALKMKFSRLPNHQTQDQCGFQEQMESKCNFISKNLCYLRFYRILKFRCINKILIYKKTEFLKFSCLWIKGTTQTPLPQTMTCIFYKSIVILPSVFPEVHTKLELKFGFNMHLLLVCTKLQLIHV